MFDAAVFLPTCDKVVPSFLMAAAKVNIPSIFVTGGPMKSGCFNDQPVVMSDIVEGFGALEKGQINRADFDYMLENTCLGPGACPLMATANTVCSIAEALGMSFPGNATIPAVSSHLIKMARKAGRQVLDLLKRYLYFNDQLASAAIENAIKVTLVIGGSTKLRLTYTSNCILAGAST